MTKQTINILAALQTGCYLAELAGRLFLVDDRLPGYKRLVAGWILDSLIAAGLVSETASSVWTEAK